MAMADDTAILTSLRSRNAADRFFQSPPPASRSPSGFESRMSLTAALAVFPSLLVMVAFLFAGIR